MPHYFFDVQSPRGVMCLDHQGLDCSDDTAALALARHGDGFTSAGDCECNPQLKSYRFAVADADRHLLFTVPFTDLLPDEEPAAAVRKRRPQASSRRPGAPE
ncbi:DUF6894 family protein [Methylobacterium longum]|uniref:DUF6894 domain-containing protein n=1 Tax=Methylobacterium longum TaxID=767694 RepID=A0ABT8ANJ2_9HYPH|nr:hypothetical protein [Methylobacterium longum]MDN3571302.1 hypothetical protein [Methylobacterium longum]